MTIALVTGSSTGIGLATAIRLADDHEVVWAAARNPDAAEGLVAAVDAANNIRTVVLDVDDDASVEAAFARVAAETGPVDVLVNNAGLGGGLTAVEVTPLEDYRQVMETNYFGLLRCTKAVLPAMRERHSGTVINVGSVSGRSVLLGQGAYAATKFAVEAITEALAMEMAPFGVHVAVIEPGIIDTPIWLKGAALPREAGYPLAEDIPMAFFNKGLQTPTAASAVADAIAAAINGDDPRLRIPVGPDAEKIIAARPHVADEDLVAMHADGVDTWKERFGAAFGFDLS